MEQVDVIPQHYFSTHPQPKGLAMKKAVSFLLVLLSLMVFVLSAAFADTETKVYRMDDLEVFCSFYYDANDDLWILTSDRLMQYTSDGVLNEVKEYYGVFNNGMCTWDDERQAYVGLKKYYANDEDDNDYAWYFVSWVPGNEPEPLLEIDFSTSKWIYGDGKLYCASRRTLSLVSEDSSITQLAETPYLVCMKYMTNGTFAAIDDRDVVIYQIQ
jgi:hypothetical protein